MTFSKVPNWINGRESLPSNDKWLDKHDPHTGDLMYEVADSSSLDVNNAVNAAESVFAAWSGITPLGRGKMLGELVVVMKKNAADLANCIAQETGKPPQDAQGEVNAAIVQAEYWAGEGMRLFGRSLTSGIPGKYSHTVRQPRGVAGLIVPANTPIANIAWKAFPALICGNTVVLKAAEDAPLIALLFAQLVQQAGIPNGVFNVIQGRGQAAGAALVQADNIGVISFTGSTKVGRWIGEVCGQRIARCSLELGGKNPFVVCDDASLEHAVEWALLSAFSNAGQRCAAASRILVFNDIYSQFKEKFIEGANELKLGTSEGCDLGPVINRRQQASVIRAIAAAKAAGGVVLCGGGIPKTSELDRGCYIQPTIIEGLMPMAELNCEEVFGPVATLHPVHDMQEALELSNATDFGLTAAIHTRSVDRAMWYAQRVRAGVVNVNLGTFGSEPHMPFGGFGASGNGTREPGVEAIDVYSETKNISIFVRDSQL